MQPLTTNQRRGATRVSIATCAVSLLLLPLAASRTFAGTARDASVLRALPQVPPPLSYPALAIRHNPFTRPTLPVVTGEDALPADFVLPPNAGIAAQPHVQALILGAVPKALVDIDGRAAIVGVGTKLEGATIVQIDSHGVELDNGERLTVEGSHL